MIVNVGSLITPISSVDGLSPTKSWSTSDLYIDPSHGGSAEAAGIATDLSGNIYTCGSSSDGTNTYWIIRKYDGASWITFDTYIYPGGNRASPNGIVCDSGNIYACGTATDGTNNYWLVRKYDGASWSNFDVYLYPGGNDSEAKGITSDGLGNLYACGYGYDGANFNWLVRKYDGTSWSNSDLYLYPGGNFAESFAITSDGLGNLYASGYGSDGTNTYWLIRKYDGTSWSNFDVYLYPGGDTSEPFAITSDGLGNLYACGFATDGINTYWLVRKYDGTSWSNFDVYLYSGGDNSGAFGIIPDGLGNLYASGYGSDGTNFNWLVRKYDGASWSNSDVYLFPGGNNTEAAGIISVGSGNLYVCGLGYDGTNFNWLVRVYS